MVAVYVPRPGTHTEERIARGSGIVGTPARNDWNEGRLVIDFERNVYGSSSMASYADRVYHAWDRHVQRYPTIARVTVAEDELVEVGSFDPETRKVSVSDAAALGRWLDLSMPDELVRQVAESEVAR